MLKRTLLFVGLAAVVLYAGDNLYYSVKLKSGKTEFSYGGLQDFECPNSLLPQYWEKPCWVAKRQKEVQINIDSGNPNNPSLF